MKDFRDELLEALLANPVEVIDIKYLTDKYCGEDDTFEAGDETKSKCRLRINRILRELEKMEWINLQPQGGMSTAHAYNHALNKRQFLDYGPVKVRLTTKGEIEYKKSKLDTAPQKPSIHVGGDFKGVLTSGDATNPTYFEAHLPADTPQANINKPKSRIKSIGIWMLDNIWKIISGLLVAYIAYRLGFKK